MNADEKWIPDHWEYVEKADAINYHYTAVAPSKYPEEDTEQTGTYRWGRIWYFRQRYDLTCGKSGRRGYHVGHAAGRLRTHGL